MERHKCILCGKAAFAYRVESDGSRDYLCAMHLPEGDAPLYEASAPAEPLQPRLVLLRSPGEKAP